MTLVIIMWIVCVIINLEIMMFLDMYDGKDVSLEEDVSLLAAILSLFGPIYILCLIFHKFMTVLTSLLIFLDNIDITLKK